MKNTSWVWKEIRREKSAKIVFLAISFSFLVTVLMFIVSGTFIKNVPVSYTHLTLPTT